MEFPACALTGAELLELSGAHDAAALFHRVVVAVVSAQVVGLVVSVLGAPARSGHGLFKGVASNHLGCDRTG